MPLIKSSSKEAFKTNVRNLMHEVGSSPHVQSRAQALAIAYATKRRGKAEGGRTGTEEALQQARDLPEPPYITEMRRVGKQKKPQEKAVGGALQTAYALKRQRRAMGGPIHSGPIMSMVPGRTDKHKMRVKPGSYVVPSETVSHLGQNNTMAGMKVLSQMFGNKGPYGGITMAIKHGPGGPRPPGRMTSVGGARGSQDGKPVPIVAAGGEYVIEPHIVQAIGRGNIDHGHKILDNWVLSTRDDHIKTLKNLAPPAK